MPTPPGQGVFRLRISLVDVEPTAMECTSTSTPKDEIDEQQVTVLRAIG